MDFTNKRAIVTGGAGGIGRTIVEYLLKAGCRVIIIDLDAPDKFVFMKNLPHPLAGGLPTRPPSIFQGDIADRQTLEKFVDSLSGPIDFLIHNACASRGGLLSGCTWEDFEYIQRVGVTAPYYLTQQLLSRNLLNPGASVVNIASTRAFQSQADTESYSAAKGGIIALTHAMAVSLAGRARVNAISPGWIDTAEAPSHSGPDQAQHPAGRVGKPQDVAEMVLFLCDNDRAGFITGENIVIDGGMSRLMVYHGDMGWTYSGAGSH
ncbi:MAG: SDR family oxidoreductase [Defluviitaleaceae bacterium]|nr:SDR family oxidoreductase [Defluviitaleaceae bacterium]